MSEKELEILFKSTVQWDNGKNGWIAFDGGDISRQPSQAEKDIINKLYKQGYLEVETSWGMNWYRVIVKKLIDIISDLQDIRNDN